MKQSLKKLKIQITNKIQIIDPIKCTFQNELLCHLYQKLQRAGFLKRDCQRLLETDRNYFSACLLSCGYGDAMVTGTTRKFSVVIQILKRTLWPNQPKFPIFGFSIIIHKGNVVLIADTAINNSPNKQELCQIAKASAQIARKLGLVPRLAFLSYANFGHPYGEDPEKIREAVKLMDEENINFEYDGEMSPQIALNPKLQKNYPFMRLTSAANILIMPAMNSAKITCEMLTEFSNAEVIGPIIVGLEKPVQITPLNGSDKDIFTMATIAASEL